MLGRTNVNVLRSPTPVLPCQDLGGSGSCRGSYPEMGITPLPKSEILTWFSNLSEEQKCVEILSRAYAQVTVVYGEITMPQSHCREVLHLAYVLMSASARKKQNKTPFLRSWLSLFWPGIYQTSVSLPGLLTNSTVESGESSSGSSPCGWYIL